MWLFTQWRYLDFIFQLGVYGYGAKWLGSSICPRNFSTHAHQQSKCLGLFLCVCGWRKAKKESVPSNVCVFLFCCCYIKGQNNIMRSYENLKYANIGYCYLTLAVYFPVLTCQVWEDSILQKAIFQIFAISSTFRFCIFNEIMQV